MLLVHSTWELIPLTSLADLRPEPARVNLVVAYSRLALRLLGLSSSLCCCMQRSGVPKWCLAFV